ncbi:hypothetical protein AMTRI_Chr10g3290 [Amborella trichopoda]
MKKTPITSKETTNNGHVLPVRRLSLVEMQAKGLCFNCNEKFVPGHRCKKLILIEGCYEDEFRELPEISLHAIWGIQAPKIMRVKSSFGHIAVMVLIDSGSTHNFMSETLAKKVGYEVVLGAQWLRTLGPIMWDFARLLMIFKVVGKEVTLKGVTSFNDKVIGYHKECCYTYIRLGLHFLRLMVKINLLGCNEFWMNSKTCSRSSKDYHLLDHMIIGFH